MGNFYRALSIMKLLFKVMGNFDMLNSRIGQYFVTHILSCILFVLPPYPAGLVA
jgi:hypothetical protein